MKVEDITRDYNPSEEVLEKTRYIYGEVKYMLNDVMGASYTEFNNRTLRQFLDDSQKRANSYVPTREEQGKEEWQANFFSKTTRNKVKAHIAGIAKNPPDISISAYNDKDEDSIKRAEIMKILVDSSYVSGDNNPQLDMYLDGWNGAINGTIVKYDGYLKVKNKVKIVTDYDPTTGEITTEEKEVVVNDECVEINIPVQNFLIRDAYIREVQKQPAVCWVEYIDRDRLEFEYGNFKNFKYVKSGKELIGQEEVQLFFKADWAERAESNKYEVAKYFRKFGKYGDMYCIVINGVMILDAPLLWGNKKKKYPFPKGIYEFFANTEFFWGNSLPNILMGEQDVENAFVNSLTDEVYRSVTTPMLIGMVNKDDFDLEDENVTADTRIYVQDVSQVTPMPVKGISQGDIAMLNIIKQGLADDSTDKVQGGATGSGSTAREIVIANERADELKGLFFTMMTDLWLQKYRLRILNILMNYNSPKVEGVVGEGGQVIEPIFKVYRLSNTKLYNGKTGTEQIEVVANESKKQRGYQLDTRELEYEMQGKLVAITQITANYLDDYDYIVKIEPDGMYQKSKALKMAMVDDKMMLYAKLFPQIFLSNQNEFFKMVAETFGDNAEKLLEASQNLAMPPGIPTHNAPQGAEMAAGVPDTAGMGKLPNV